MEVRSKLEVNKRTYKRMPQEYFLCRIDSALDGGLMSGEITELIGPSCSGKTQVKIVLLNQFLKNRLLVWSLVLSHICCECCISN